MVEQLKATQKICYLDKSPLEELTYANVNITKLNNKIENSCKGQQKCSIHF